MIISPFAPPLDQRAVSAAIAPHKLTGGVGVRKQFILITNHAQNQRLQRNTVMFASTPTGLAHPGKHLKSTSLPSLANSAISIVSAITYIFWWTS